MREATIAVLLAVALAGGTRALADEPPPTTTTEPRPPIVHMTDVKGTLPELEGRWLLVTSVGIGTSAKRVIPSVFDVRRNEGKLEFRERHVVLPAAQQEAVRRATDELGGVWAPTPDDLAAIDRAWDTLEIEDRGIAQIDYHLNGRDAWDDDLKADAVTKDALWALRQVYTFLPGGSRPVNQANLIAPLKVEDGVYSGNYLAVAVAAAPFPVPIKFEGTFRLVPIGRAGRPWWARIGDFFAGCGGSR